MARLTLKERLSQPKTWLALVFIGLSVTAYAAVNTFDNLKSNKLNVDNIQLDGNVISTTNSNGDLTVTPNGTGQIILSPLTASTVPYLDASKKLTSSAATPTQLGYLANATSNICGTAQSCTLSNKTIDSASNTITLSASTITSGTLPVSRGGTGSGTALNNNRIMQSTSGNIVEAAAITASRALVSDSNGIPTHSSVTSTELGYLSGVTSAIQSQINAKGAGTVTNVSVSTTYADGISVANGSTTPVIALSNILSLGGGSVASGRVDLYGVSSGGSVKLKPNDSTLSYNFNFPVSAGSSGDLLTSGGGFSNAMTWSTPSSSVTANAIVKRDASGYLRGDIADSSGNRMFDTTNGFIRNAGGTVLADMTGAYMQMTQGMRLINPTLAPAITLQSNSSGSAYTFTFPPNGGTAGFVLTTDGSGTTSWTTASAGTVTNVSATSPLSVTNGSTTPNISLGTVPETKGGTNQTSYSTGDMLYASASNTLSKLAMGGVTGFLGYASGVPGWTTFIPPILQEYVSSTTWYLPFAFKISTGSATSGATYTNNSVTFTVIGTVSSGTLVYMSGNGTPSSSGTLTKASGTGDSTLTFSRYASPRYLEVWMVGGGGGGGGGGNQSGIGTSGGGSGGNSDFGSLCTCTGGAGGGASTSAGGTCTISSPAYGTASQGDSGKQFFASDTGASGQFGTGGPGGSTIFGSGGGGVANGAGTAANAYSGGGGGGGGFTTAATLRYANTGGGAGGFARFIVPAPLSTSYSLTVGGGGSGGAASTTGNGFAGGAGASGRIAIYSFFD